MYRDVVEVKPEPHYCLFVRFKDDLAIAPCPSFEIGA